MNKTWMILSPVPFITLTRFLNKQQPSQWSEAMEKDEIRKLSGRQEGNRDNSSGGFTTRSIVETGGGEVVCWQTNESQHIKFHNLSGCVVFLVYPQKKKLKVPATVFPPSLDDSISMKNYPFQYYYPEGFLVNRQDAGCKKTQGTQSVLFSVFLPVSAGSRRRRQNQQVAVVVWLELQSCWPGTGADSRRPKSLQRRILPFSLILPQHSAIFRCWYKYSGNKVTGLISITSRFILSFTSHDTILMLHCSTSVRN